MQGRDNKKGKDKYWLCCEAKGENSKCPLWTWQQKFLVGDFFFTIAKCVSEWMKRGDSKKEEKPSTKACQHWLFFMTNGKLFIESGMKMKELGPRRGASTLDPRLGRVILTSPLKLYVLTVVTLRFQRLGVSRRGPGASRLSGLSPGEEWGPAPPVKGSPQVSQCSDSSTRYVWLLSWEITCTQTILFTVEQCSPSIIIFQNFGLLEFYVSHVIFAARHSCQ